MKTHPKQAKSGVSRFRRETKTSFFVVATTSQHLRRRRSKISTDHILTRRLTAANRDGTIFFYGGRRSEYSRTGTTADPDTTFRQTASRSFHMKTFSGCLSTWIPVSVSMHISIHMPGTDTSSRRPQTSRVPKSRRVRACVCACARARVSTCVCACLHACVGACVGAWVHGCMGAWVHGCVGACASARVHVCEPVCVYERARARVYVRATVRPCDRAWVSACECECLQVHVYMSAYLRASACVPASACL